MGSRQNRKGVYWTLFTSTFKLSASTFGGGYVIVPLMREKFVNQLHWIDEQEMLDLIAIAQSSPGAIAVNTSLLVGYRVAGFPGALVTVLGTVLPPLAIISVVSFFYGAVRDNPVVNMAMTALLAGVAAVVCNVVITMGWDVLKKRRLLPVLILVGSFVAARYLKVNIIIILLVCGAIGAVDTLVRRRKEGPGT